MLERIKPLLDSFDSKANKWKNYEDGQEAKRIYFQLTGTLLQPSCTSCHLDAFMTLTYFYKNPNKIKQMETQKFKLKPGSLIDTTMAVEGPNGHFSAHNMTDETALGLLKAQPKHIKHFETAPADWEKQAASFKLEKKKAEVKVEAPAPIVETIPAITEPASEEPAKAEVKVEAPAKAKRSRSKKK